MTAQTPLPPRFEPLRRLGVANLITLGRILLLPFFFAFNVYFLREKYVPAYWWALGVLVIMLASDMLDGWVARRLHRTTPLGSFLDPLADKIFVNASFVLYAYYHLIPFWLLIMVFSRDFALVVGWGLLFITDSDTQIRPSRLGKTAALLEFTVVLVALIFAYQQPLRLIPLTWIQALATLLHTQWLWGLTGVVAIVSGLLYLLEGLGRMNQPGDDASGSTS